ncbi:hypothetical protein EYC84_004635 [Monilinia fructicola]|uniref:Uncharacterized protein n=1 Tax=Monilinia fructicola TaxID=38448 RepID=A0A5M9K629_MONFR|nr:hypothetical protein EYC84_004635 [Monilinia fructicola]
MYGWPSYKQAASLPAWKGAWGYISKIIIGVSIDIVDSQRPYTAPPHRAQPHHTRIVVPDRQARTQDPPRRHHSNVVIAAAPHVIKDPDHPLQPPSSKTTTTKVTRFGLLIIQNEGCTALAPITPNYANNIYMWKHSIPQLLMLYAIPIQMPINIAVSIKCTNAVYFIPTHGLTNPFNAMLKLV